MDLPLEFDKLIEILLNIDTSKAIDDLAKSIFAASCFAENIPIEDKTFHQMGDTKFQIIGITLLAVDDAKNTDQPSSANPIYKAVFGRAKELINHETRSPQSSR